MMNDELWIELRIEWTISNTSCTIINYIIVLVEAVFVAPRSEELGIAT